MHAQGCTLLGTSRALNWGAGCGQRGRIDFDRIIQSVTKEISKQIMITCPEGDGGGPIPKLATIYYLCIIYIPINTWKVLLVYNTFQFSTKKKYDMQRKREVRHIDDKY